MLFTTLVLQYYPQGYIFSYFFKTPLGFFLSRMLVEFSLTWIFHHLWEKLFNLWCFIPRKCIESMHFDLFPRIFWKFVSPKAKGVQETMICFMKVESENMKTTWNISLFIFSMICNYTNCDGFAVLWVISIK